MGSSAEYSPDLLTELNDAIDDLHGTEEDRINTSKLAFETTHRANTVQGGRSYGLGLSLQTSKARVTVNKGDKFGGEEDEALVGRRKILNVSENISKC
jgi:hypothetical protein